METINLKSEVKVKEETKPKKVDWSAFIERKMPNWKPKYKRTALGYLNENNPKSVTLTDKPIKNLESTVIIGGGSGSIPEFVAKLEKEGYETKLFRKFFGLGFVAILEVK